MPQRGIGAPPTLYRVSFRNREVKAMTIETMSTPDYLIVVNDCHPSLCLIIDGKFYYADPQPNEDMLLDAIEAQNGAINMSGFYHITPRIMVWLRENTPHWKPPGQRDE
jgi:hypothetical protein